MTTPILYSPDAVSRLLHAVRHPETVDDWNPADRLDELAAAFVTADRETRDELIAEAAELLADPRTREQIDMDEWDADWRATNESNRP